MVLGRFSAVFIGTIAAIAAQFGGTPAVGQSSAYPEVVCPVTETLGYVSPVVVTGCYRYDQKVNRANYRVEKRSLKTEKKIAKSLCPEQRAAYVSDVQMRKKIAKADYRDAQAVTAGVYRAARRGVPASVVALPAVVQRAQAFETDAVESSPGDLKPIPNPQNGVPATDSYPTYAPHWDGTTVGESEPERVNPSAVLPAPEPTPTPAVRP